MMKFDLEEAIYNRYILPTKRSRTRKVGLEFEYPIVNLSGGPVDFDIVHQVTRDFVQAFSFDECLLDQNGAIYSARHTPTDDDLSFDCSYNTLEFSLGADENLFSLQERFQSYYSYIRKALLKENHTLTGMGINPQHACNLNEPVPTERYRMLYHHLCSYPAYGNQIPFHNKPNYGFFSCASQVQLDAGEKDLVLALNTFSYLEPIKALLFANSLWGKRNKTLCIRDYLWRNSLHGLNRHNVDMYCIEFESEDDIVSYIESMSLFCVERDHRYIHFRPTPLADYFAADHMEGERFEDGSFKTIRFRPSPSDLQWLRSYKFEDLTFRGTIEFRSVCEQPVSEAFACGALHAGLMENLTDLCDCLHEDHSIYHRGYNACELRHMFVKRKLPDLFNYREVSKLALGILDIANKGLIKRGMGEETLLLPLYRRASELISPAREMALALDQGASMEEYIERYGCL